MYARGFWFITENDLCAKCGEQKKWQNHSTGGIHVLLFFPFFLPRAPSNCNYTVPIASHHITSLVKHNDNNTTTKHLYPSTMSIYLAIKWKLCVWVHTNVLRRFASFIFRSVVGSFFHLLLFIGHKKITSDTLCASCLCHCIFIICSIKKDREREWNNN